MFDIGFWEISLIAAISLLILGPERLPRVARTAGMWVNKMKRMVADVKSNIDEELRMEDMKELQQAGEDLKQSLTETQRELGSAATDLKSKVEAESESIEQAVSDNDAGKSTDAVDVVSAIKDSAPDLSPPVENSSPPETESSPAEKTVTRKSAKNKVTANNEPGTAPAKETESEKGANAEQPGNGQGTSNQNA